MHASTYQSLQKWFRPCCEWSSYISLCYVKHWLWLHIIFHGFGNTTLLAALFEYSNVFSSDSAQASETLAHNKLIYSLMFFLRLVECGYFRKHNAVFYHHILPPTPFSSHSLLMISCNNLLSITMLCLLDKGENMDSNQVWRWNFSILQCSSETLEEIKSGSICVQGVSQFPISSHTHH